MKVSTSLLQRAIARHGAEAVLGAMDADERAALLYSWPIVGRTSQFAPVGSWRWWLNTSGRGAGKTRSGAEWFREKVRRMPGGRGALVNQTPEEVERVQIEGQSGLLAVCPANERPKWFASRGELEFPNGFVAFVYSGAQPDKARGPEHHIAWIDELAKMALHRALFDNLNLGLRLEYHGGDPRDVQPQGLITTTPRPISLLRELVKKPSTVRRSSSTYENRANLARGFVDDIIASYEGTRLGRQELHGEILDDAPGALWQRAMFDAPGFRRPVPEQLKEYGKIAVSMDPAASNTESSDETGIIAAGVEFVGQRRRYHVFEDASIYGTPSQRARAAIKLYVKYEADVFVVETNNGGDWIPALIEAEWSAMQHEEVWREHLKGKPKVEKVTATRGKAIRAEPISTLYEQGPRTVTHAPGLEVLEDQLVTWSPLLNEASPDRLDALVWNLTYLSTAKRVVLT